MSLLPLRGESTTDPDEPRVVGLAGEEADETFEVLSSATTRKVLAALYEQPSTPSEVRDDVGTSLQNVHYHLDKLEDADLIEPAGVGYSEKGTEMTVFAPTSEAVVLFAGRRDDRSRLRSLLARVFGVVLALGVGSAVLRQFLESQTAQSFSGGSGGDGAESGGGADDGASGGADGAGDGSSGGADGGYSTTGDDADVAGEGTSVPDTESGDGVSIAGNEETAADQSTPDAADATADVAQQTADVVKGTADAVSGGDPAPLQQVAEALAADPALAFFLGGVFALCVVGLVWYATR